MVAPRASSHSEREQQQPNRRRQNSVAKPGPHALGSAGNTAPPDATRTGRDAQSTDIVGVAAGSGVGSCSQSKSSLQAAGATAADRPAATLLRDVPSVGRLELPDAQSASDDAPQRAQQQQPKHSSPGGPHGARAVAAQLTTALAGVEPALAGSCAAARGWARSWVRQSSACRHAPRHMLCAWPECQRSGASSWRRTCTPTGAWSARRR